MKVTCGDILFTPLRELITEAVSSFELYEVDPKKIPESRNLDDNINNLINLVSRFLDIIFNCTLPM